MNCKKVSQEIIDWLINYNDNEAKTNGFIVGVSGGVDSALVSTLCAMTNKPTVLVEMPIHRTVSNISKRATEHCDWLKQNHHNISYHYNDLTIPYNSFVDIHILRNSSLAKANLSSRLRMVNLYYYANTFNCLVVGTGNRVEDFGVGFFTRYGDGGVDISPIGDLMKSEVRELAAYLDVSPDIVEATPTDELWSDTRSDEDQIGASYDQLEWAMNIFDKLSDDEDEYITHQIKKYGFINNSTSTVYNNLSDEEKKIFDIFIKRHVKNEFKNYTPPICYINEKE